MNGSSETIAWLASGREMRTVCSSASGSLRTPPPRGRPGAAPGLRAAPAPAAAGPQRHQLIVGVPPLLDLAVGGVDQRVDLALARRRGGERAGIEVEVDAQDALLRGPRSRERADELLADFVDQGMRRGLPGKASGLFVLVGDVGIRERPGWGLRFEVPPGLASSSFCASSASDTAGRGSISVSARSRPPVAMRAYHLWSAGTRCHQGAHSVLVCESISENACW